MLSGVAPSWNLLGFDVSGTQSTVSWKVLAERSTFSFAFIEAAQGAVPSSNFQSVWNTRVPGIVCAPYQIIRGGSSGKEHANALIALFTSPGCQFTDSDLPPVLDLEDEHDKNGSPLPRLPREHYIAILDEWLTTVSDHFKRTPMLYTNHDFGDYLGGSSPKSYTSGSLKMAACCGLFADRRANSSGDKSPNELCG
jgi:GH25 family lysozyme M1 (1,4-beta-N-acetylmuramidase)